MICRYLLRPPTKNCRDRIMEHRQTLPPPTLIFFAPWTPCTTCARWPCTPLLSLCSPDYHLIQGQSQRKCETVQGRFSPTPNDSRRCSTPIFLDLMFPTSALSLAMVHSLQEESSSLTRLQCGKAVQVEIHCRPLQVQTGMVCRLCEPFLIFWALSLCIGEFCKVL